MTFDILIQILSFFLSDMFYMALIITQPNKTKRKKLKLNKKKSTT